MSRVAEDRLERWEHETLRRKWDSAMQEAALRRSAAGHDSDDAPDPIATSIARAIDDRLALLERRTRQLKDRADLLENRWRCWRRGMLCVALIALGLIAVARPESLVPGSIRLGTRPEEPSGSTASPSALGASDRGE